MILSILVILSAMVWLLIETDLMRIRLAVGSIEAEKPEPIKRRPILEPCVVKTVHYPEPETVKLLAEYCGATEFQNKVVREKWKALDPDNCINWQMKPSYQQMNIGGHTLTILSTSHKLYEMMADFQKITDGKIRSTTGSLILKTAEDANGEIPMGYFWRFDNKKFRYLRNWTNKIVKTHRTS